MLSLTIDLPLSTQVCVFKLLSVRGRVLGVLNLGDVCGTDVYRMHLLKTLSASHLSHI